MHGTGVDILTATSFRVVSSNWHYKLNQRNKYLFCPIPKSGWSSWKRLWHYTSGLISSYATDVGTGSDVKAGVMDVRGTLAIKRAYAQQQYSYSFVFVRLAVCYVLSQL